MGWGSHRSHPARPACDARLPHRHCSNSALGTSPLAPQRPRRVQHQSIRASSSLPGKCLPASRLKEPVCNAIASQSAEVAVVPEIQVGIPSTEVQPGISYGVWPSSHSQSNRHVEFISDEGGYNTVRGRLRVPGASPQLIWQVLTDYNGSADVYSSITASQLELVEGRKEVVQKCIWSFLAFSGTFDTRLAVTEDPSTCRLVFNLIHSSFMQDFEGRWQIQLLPPESTSDDEGIAPVGQEFMIEHVLSVKPNVPIPPPFSFYTRSIFVQQVDTVLQDLQREIVRQQSLAVAIRN